MFIRSRKSSWTIQNKSYVKLKYLIYLNFKQYNQTINLVKAWRIHVNRNNTVTVERAIKIKHKKSLEVVGEDCGCKRHVWEGPCSGIAGW